MESTDLSIDTSRRQLTDLTSDVSALCRSLGNGLLSVFVPHATAGVALMETGSGSEADVEELLGRLLPRDDRYRHRHGPESPGDVAVTVGHGADHVLPVLVSPSVVIPVRSGRMQLGTWQSLVLVDFNADNPRRTVRLSFLGG